MAFIYCITNTTNDKKYVGKCTQSIEKRWKTHIKDSKYKMYENRPLYDAINKYGSESFLIEAIEECSETEVDNREIFWINKLGTFGKGYNATLGGDGTVKYDYVEKVNTYKTGLTVKETAKKIGCCTDTVTKALENYEIDGYKNFYKKISVQVEQYSKSGEFIKSFDSITDAANITGIIRTSISRAANGKLKTAGGYVWKFKD